VNTTSASIERARTLPVQCAIIKDATDALDVMNRVLATVEYMMEDPAHCEGTRARLDRDREALGEVVKWAQGVLAKSWELASTAHPERAKRKRKATGARAEIRIGTAGSQGSSDPSLTWRVNARGEWRCVG
jgi:hypothetical protein